MTQYKFYNNIAGWVTFLVASIIFIMTVEPTVSFWDCGEFIASSYKLEVGHPPGAPFFMIVARFFTLFAGSNVELVAKMVNIMSALTSAFTILFLFWTITHLARKIVIKDNNFTIGSTIAIIGSGLVGALAYTFSDTFWFSATEGEVYAFSSLFTAVIFWAILKWEDVAHEKYANRWIILIAYLIGLSIGVHLLNLLAIPAIVMVYYLKKYKPTISGVITALITSVIILGFIMYFIIPGVIKVASWFELLFVNGFRLPYNSGVLFYAILLIVLIIWGIAYTTRKKNIVLNTILVSFSVILIGYSSFTMVVIRSIANPPMDENSPDDVFALQRYLNREQYGDRPLFFGEYYNAKVTGQEKNHSYSPENGKYIKYKTNPSYTHDPDFRTFFPRMFSSDKKHIDIYKKWANIKGRSVRTRNQKGEMETLTVPTFGENLKFFFKYQIGHMYLRYFMWNFSGRQNDTQNTGNGQSDLFKGNWISGIKFIDEFRLGSQENLPDKLANNKSRNKYFLLPLILGIIGLVFHYRNKNKDFWIVSLLFILTGLAIVIYLNQTPSQPRERDYAYAGSFYAFSIWIGLGILAIYDLLKRIIPSSVSAVISTLLCLVFVPGIMAKENWDDHDRSGRYTARDFAYNYLNSCEPNAIIFTNGDNDTFPLWYAQEVEGIRTDVRVCNLSYLSADWYIDQMARKAYESDPLPFTLTRDKYVRGKRDVVPIYERIDNYIDSKDIIDFIASDDPKSKINSPWERETKIDYIPTKKIKISVDAAKVIANGTVHKSLEDKIVPEILWTINKSYLLKNDLMTLDLLATNNWERPIYFAITVGSNSYLNLEDYFQMDGLAYRFVPIKNEVKDRETGRIQTDIMYNNLMNKFRWGGIEESDVYLDENNQRMLTNFRNIFTRLANSLIAENKKDSAITVLDRCMELMPHERIPFNYFILPIAKTYYKAGEPEKANQIIEKLAEITESELNYYFTIGDKFASLVDYERQLNSYIFQQLIKTSQAHNQNELSDQLKERFNTLFSTHSISP